MKVRPRYRRQQYVLTIEYNRDGVYWPQRESLPVRDIKQARAEIVRFMFVKDMKPVRAWVAKYSYGNTTYIEQEIALSMWQRCSYSIGMPGWAYKEIYLIGSDRI